MGQCAIWQQPETSWTVFVGGYLSPGALYFNREVRPQGTDLWIQWGNCVTAFEKKHTSTCTGLEGVEISNMMQPNIMSNMTLTDDHASLENTLKGSEPADDIGHLRTTFLNSSSAIPFSLLQLLYDRGLSVLFKSELAGELGVYSNALSPTCVQPAH